MHLKVQCSADVAAMSKVPPDRMGWSVESTQRFGHEHQIQSLKNSLGLDFPETTLEEAGLELLFYRNGPGAPIDLTRSPKDLGMENNMTVYLRKKGVTSRLADVPTETPGRVNVGGHGGSPGHEPAPQRYAADEKKVLDKLRLYYKPTAPDKPCPVCDRTELSIHPSMEGGRGHHRGSRQGGPNRVPLFGEAHLGYDPSVVYPDGTTPDRGHGLHDVSVQCGQGGRVNAGESIDVRFGTSSRLRETGHGALEGPQPLRTVQQQSAAAELEDSVASLRHDLQRSTSDISQLKKQLEEMKAQREVALQWRKEHVCNPTEEVRKLREQLDVLHQNLRDVLRGREEALVFLGQRRTVGVQNYQDPLTHRAPKADLVYPTPVKDLLSTQSTFRHRPPDSSMNATTPALATTMGDSSNWKTDHLANGYCILRVTSVHSQPFYVKRAVGSRVDLGRHVMTLSSLDGVVTDEIWLDEVEVVRSEPNTNAIVVMARHNRWTLFFNDAERSKWLKWYYTLNPYLSANEETTHTSYVPNTY